MVDQLGHSRDEVVIMGAASVLCQAPMAREDDYRDEYEGDASAGPGHFRNGYSDRLLAQVTSRPWELDDGEM